MGCAADSPVLSYVPADTLKALALRIKIAC
jgi:hypothetical protein